MPYSILMEGDTQTHYFHSERGMILVVLCGHGGLLSGLNVPSDQALTRQSFFIWFLTMWMTLNGAVLTM